MEAIIGMGINKVSQAFKRNTETFEVTNQIAALNPITVDKLKQENIYTKMQGIQASQTTGTTSIDRITSILFILFWVILGAISAYLSWSSNTLIQWDTPYKIIFAIGAFLFPIYYLLMYFIGKLSLIRYIQRRGC